MTETTPVRVLIADDHPMFRFGLAAAIGTAPEINLLGEAASGAELIDMVDRTTPDVVITDLAMPGTDGISATQQIVARHPEVAVLVLTMHEDDEALFGAIRAGAQGYLLKGADGGDIIRAVLTVARGGAVYGTSVARRIMDFFTGAHKDYAVTVFPELTCREREILELVAAGHNNHVIARRLVLSEKTIRNHVASILTKLQATDRAAAVAKARDAGLGKTR
jgi:DNA-binding NarL/FixJ family response regulator